MKTVTIQYGPANSITKQVADYATYREIINDRNLQAALGYGSNVQALEASRRAVNLDAVIPHGASILLETVANTKGEDIVVTIEYGPANSMTKTYPAGTTVGQIRTDRSLRAALGFGDNSKVLIDRHEQPDNAPVEHGDRLVIETVANTKGY